MTISTNQVSLHDGEAKPQFSQFYSGNNCNLYSADGDPGIVVEMTDRLSAFGKVIEESIPMKGEILNSINLSIKSFLSFAGFATDYIFVSSNYFTSLGFANVQELLSRLTYVKALKMLPLRFIVRNYMVGSLYEAYTKNEVHNGYAFSGEMSENDKLRCPVVVLTTKKKDGLDTAISKDSAIELLTDWIMENVLPSPSQLEKLYYEDSYSFFDSLSEKVSEEDIIYARNARKSTNLETIWERGARALAHFKARDFVEQGMEISLNAFNHISNMYLTHGILLVDSEFNFGVSQDSNEILVLGGEVGTPDSSHLAYYETYKKTGKLVNIGKQIVYDYYTSIGFTGKNNDDVPKLPEEVKDKLSQTYFEIGAELCKQEPFI